MLKKNLAESLFNFQMQILVWSLFVDINFAVKTEYGHGVRGFQMNLISPTHLAN